jgi:hypothetical protein
LFALNSVAQTQGVHPEDVLNSALSMKAAAEEADNLTPKGKEYCNWDIDRVKSSDLEAAISGLLLEGKLIVPQQIPASRMLRVSFVADEILNQLRVDEIECALLASSSGGAHSLFRDIASIQDHLAKAKAKFETKVGQQIIFQEENSRQALADAARNGDRHRQDSDALDSAREIKHLVENAALVTQNAMSSSVCLELHPSTTSGIDLGELDGLPSPTTHFLLAGSLWAEYQQFEVARLDAFYTTLACAPNASEKKKARILMSQALDAYHNLRREISKFAVLALHQTEWEEQHSSGYTAGEQWKRFRRGDTLRVGGRVFFDPTSPGARGG